MPSRILYRLYIKLASDVSRVLFKSRLILSSLNGPNVIEVTVCTCCERRCNFVTYFIKAYMEDHLKNENRLSKEWEV